MSKNTALDDVQHSISSELDMLRKRINEALMSNNQLMNRVVEGYLESKGKLIRPILVILTAKLFGQVNDNVISSAAAVEMLHNASLIHDDVVDDSMLRRGRPTINSLWDNHIAVLTGDFFVSSALQQAIRTADIRIVETLAGLGRLLSIGEIDQIYNARHHSLDEKTYFQIISRKTASLFVACIKMGAYSVNAPQTDIDKMCRYAELLGLCFQIKDDIFDYFSDTAIGKPTGNDLREGKITLPLLYALANDKSPRHEEMLALSRKEELTTEEINTLIEYAKDCGGINYAYDTMQHFSDEASKILAEFPESETSRAFNSIFDFIIVRNK